MKKILSVLLTGLMAATMLSAQDAPADQGPAKLPSLTLSGYFETTVEVAKSVDGDEATTNNNLFMGIGGFGADANGSGVNYKGAVYSGDYVPGIPNSAAYQPWTYDLHISLFDRKLFTAIGKFEDESFILRGPVTSQDYITRKMGKDRDMGLMTKVSPVQGLAAGLYYPILETAPGTYYKTATAIQKVEAAVQYDLDGMGRIIGGYNGYKESFFANFKTAPGFIERVSAGAGFDYTYKSGATQSRIGVELSYAADDFVMTTENVVALSDVDPVYSLALRTDVPVNKDVARLDLRYTDNFGEGSFEGGSMDNLVVVHPQYIMKADVVPFADLNVGYKYVVNLDDSASSYWSVPITITMFIPQ